MSFKRTIVVFLLFAAALVLATIEAALTSSIGSGPSASQFVPTATPPAPDVASPRAS